MKIDGFKLFLSLVLFLLISNQIIYAAPEMIINENKAIYPLYKHVLGFKDDRYIFAIVLISILFVIMHIYIRYLRRRISGAYSELAKKNKWFKIILSSLGEAVITTDEKELSHLATWRHRNF